MSFPSLAGCRALTVTGVATHGRDVSNRSYRIAKHQPRRPHFSSAFRGKQNNVHTAPLRLSLSGQIVGVRATDRDDDAGDGAGGSGGASDEGADAGDPEVQDAIAEELRIATKLYQAQQVLEDKKAEYTPQAPNPETLTLNPKP